MKILIINPNSDVNTNGIMIKKADAYIEGDYKVDCVSLRNTPKLISSYEDYADCIPEMVEIVRNNEEEYDAFIVACHADPNLDLMKEITDKPIIGIAEASMKLASFFGNSFAVISPSKKSISKKIALARKYHCNDLMKAVKVSKSDNKKDLLEAARIAVEENDVDVIVLGCANYANADKFIEEELNVKVLDGVACALILASGLIKYEKYKA